MSVLSIRKVVKDYTNHRALDHVSIEIEKGSLFGLLGPNGAGKTSLIRIITSITKPDTGEVFLDGQPVDQKTPEQIGYMPEERGLYKKMEVFSQLIYLARIKGLDRKDAIEKINYWLNRFGIEDWKKKKIQDLSKGMQQKIQFIATVMHEPKLIILDEPFSGLDPVNTELIKKEIFRLNQEGASILFSTHRMESVEEICDEIVLLNKGKIHLQGKVKEVKEQFKTNSYRFTFKDKVVMPNVDGVTIVTKDSSELIIKAETEKQIHAYFSQIIQSGSMISSFEEILPSVNDIFIQLIGETSKNQ